MRRIAYSVGTFLFFLILSSSVFPQSADLIYKDGNVLHKISRAPEKPDFVPNQIIIKLRTPKTSDAPAFQSQSAASSAAYSLLLKKYKVREVTQLFRRTAFRAANGALRSFRDGMLPSSFLKSFQDRGLANVHQVYLEPGMDVMAAVEDFRKLPEVEYAELNYQYHTQASLNDPYLASEGSWGQPYQDLWGLYKISAPDAWDIATGAGVLVAVVDTGCDINHPDLADNIWRNPGEIPYNGLDDDGNGYVDDVTGWNFIDETNSVEDNFGHGTHVAGTAAADGNNGLGVAGVAWSAKVMAVKGLDDRGSGYMADVANAILYAVENGARIINMSWGGPQFSSAIEDAFSLAASQNVTLVASAGNNGSWAHESYPAYSRYVIAVGATDMFDNQTNFTNFGDPLDVMAPGGANTDESPERIYSNILSLRSSTLNGAITEPMMTVGSNYLRLRGTSMAAPHVSGLAALILERFPSATPEEVRQVIRRSADYIPGAVEEGGWGAVFGYGRINALKAMNTTALGSARIFNPVPPAKTSADSVSLKITASCPNFSQWELDYYDTNMNFASISSSTSPRTNYQLPSWNTESTPDGAYVLRLRVRNQQGDLFLDKINIDLDRVNITAPASKSAYRSGQVITITGTAGGGGFTNFVIQYQDSTSEEWHSDGITLIDGGTRKISNGILGTWDTSNINRPEILKVRLSVKRMGLDDAVEETYISVDPALHPGWPINVGLMKFGARHLIAADLDRDGQMEIPVGFGDGVRVFRSDGTMAPGWPQNTYKAIQTSPVAADINNDGYLEVAVSDQSALFVWDYRGTLLPGFPSFDCNILDTIADHDADGRNEFICNNAWYVDLLDSYGTRRQRWPVTIEEEDESIASTSHGDLDGDGIAEIVVFSIAWSERLVRVSVLNNDGTIRTGWPVLLSNTHFNEYVKPILADLNEDGKLEIMFAAGPRIIVLRGDGSNLPNWPATMPSGNVVTGLSVGEVNGDGRARIYVGLMNENGYRETYLLLDSDGRVLPGWPFEIDGVLTLGGASAAIVDIDSDGIKDFVFGSGTPDRSLMTFSMHALRSDGREIPGFPKAVSDMDAGPGNTPVVADIDADGLLEIAWLNNSGDIYMWDTPTPAQLDSSDWPMSQHDSVLSGTSIHPVRVSLSMRAGSMASAGTYGSAGLIQVGYARGTVKSGSIPYGTAVSSYVRENAVVSETAVPVSPPTLRSRVFIDHRAGVAAMPGREDTGVVDVQTGLAVVNCGFTTANITYTLRDAAGEILATGTGLLAKDAHYAKFVDQLSEVAPEFHFPADFSAAVLFGSLDIVSDQLLSVVALRLTINQRLDPILTSTPIADLTVSPRFSPIYFPQIADGGGYLSFLALVNTSSSIQTGVLEFYRDDGSPLAVNQLGGVSGSHFQYNIPANGVYVFQTDGSPLDTNTGFAQLLPDSGNTAPVSSGFFSFMQNNVRVTETGVPATIPTTHVRLFIDTSRGHNTGVALAASGTSSATATIRAYQQDGITPIGTEKTITLSPKEHRAAFVDEMVGTLPGNFVGVLDVSSTQPFVAIALRCLINERGEFLISTYPNADMTQPAPAGPLLFPQIAAGEGYQSQFFLLSSGKPSTVLMEYLSDTGTPLRIGR